MINHVNIDYFLVQYVLILTYLSFELKIYVNLFTKDKFTKETFLFHLLLFTSNVFFV